MSTRGAYITAEAELAAGTWLLSQRFRRGLHPEMSDPLRRSRPRRPCFPSLSSQLARSLLCPSLLLPGTAPSLLCPVCLRLRPVSTPLGSDRDRGLRRVRAAERLRGKVQLAVRARAHAPSADETQAPWAAEVPTRDEDMGAGLALCLRKETCLLYEVHWGRSRKIWRHSIKNCNRHVEVSFMENFTADSRSARHCTIVWFLSWSPCSECSRAIGEFLRQRPHVRLTVYVARLYHHYAERNRRGLRNLEQSGLHIRVMRAPGRQPLEATPHGRSTTGRPLLERGATGLRGGPSPDGGAHPRRAPAHALCRPLRPRPPVHPSAC
ncbi:C-_U-editing enzyme APOBEC-1 [Galemys pyrenaicus]|uniref:C->U-editing enzyme APOBEC-1 n=1 Tax=Galemys pyrenaicus TaxID=202257 RepID=A0A8J6AFH2_GALPY|nr:C->U-editing enzyme APOBEC-1 [Galemys pyrenaicus]